MHLTYSANNLVQISATERAPQAYVSIEGVTKKGDYAQMQDDKAYYGAGHESQKGFPGDYRQFYFTIGYVDEAKIDLLKHQKKALDFNTRGHYEFEAVGDESKYADTFRKQQGRPVGTAPQFVFEEDIAVPFCSNLPQKQVQVPRFASSAPFS